MMNKFLPDYKETMQGIRNDVKNPKNTKVLEHTIDLLKDIEEECQNAIDGNGFNAKNFFKCFLGFTVTGLPAIIFASINDALTGKAKYDLKTNKAVKGKEGYNFYADCLKIAKKTLPIAKQLRKQAETKLKSMKANESFDFESFFED